MASGELSKDTKMSVVAALCRTIPRNLLGYREDAEGSVIAITPEGRVYILTQAQIEAAYSRMVTRDGSQHFAGLD